MSISFSKYINITSSVAGVSQVPARELIGRLFTNNTLLPTSSYITFTTADEVKSYFGSSSEEYKRAEVYFSFINKKFSSPQKISYARWVSADQAPMIFGAATTDTLTQWKLITNGAFSLTMNTNTFVVSGLNFSAATSFADIAADIQTGIRAEIGGGAQWTAATVTYNAQSSGFDLVGGLAENAVISVQAPGTGTDITTIMGWLPQFNGVSGAIWSDGKLTETITDTLTLSSNASNNFGSFLFLYACNLNLSQITEAGTWNAASGQRLSYQYYPSVPQGSQSTYATALSALTGVGATYASAVTTEYPEQLPMQILASTDYTMQNSTQNFMFYQDTSLTPSVTDTATSNSLDALSINYYGQTQNGDQPINFYQRGVLFGGVNDPLDMNTYANEQWLRDAMSVALMNLLLVVNKISANNQGRLKIMSTQQGVINQALFNGTISVGKILSPAQIEAISSITNDTNAWYQVQNIGYWYNCVIALVSNQYQAQYTLVYSKDDSIRSITGSQILI